MKIDELRTSVEEMRTEIRELADLEEITEEQDARLAELTAELPEREQELAKAEERQKVVERVQAGAKPQSGDGATSFTFIRTPDDQDVLSDRSASPQEIASAVLRNIEDSGQDDTNVRAVLKRHQTDTRWSRNILGRSTAAYESAWQKYATGRQDMWTPEERAAVAVGTNTQGGFLLPTHLDPTIILTNDGTANALRPISRVVTLTEGDTWYGVDSAGVTASWDAELAEVSDDSPSFAQPSIPVYKGAVYAEASVEAFQDIAGLASELVMMFGDARDRLEAAAHCTGTGSAQPTGIFTACDAAENETVSTTAATIGLVDLQAVRRAVGQRWRGRSTWVMHPEWADEIKRLGAAVSASYSTDLTQSNTDVLLGRPVVETDDAPNDATTTALDDRTVFGDFSQFVIVDKPGSMSVEFIPTVIGSNQRPVGAKGWYAYWRTGSDSVNDAAFQMLMDKTSA